MMMRFGMVADHSLSFGLFMPDGAGFRAVSFGEVRR